MKRTLIVLLIIVAVILMSYPALADTSAGVTVTAWGTEYVGAPLNFVVIYQGENVVGLSWDNAPEAAKTMVRASFNHPPQTKADGYQVYYGNGQETIDERLYLSLESGLGGLTISTVYYRAWSETSDGNWSFNFAEGALGNTTSQWLLLIIVALGITTLALWQKKFVLFLIAFIGLGLFALHFAETSMMMGIPIGLLSGYMLYRSVAYWFGSSSD